MEKDTKGLKIPYIIGSEMFNAEKAIRLDVAPEEKKKKIMKIMIKKKYQKVFIFIKNIKQNGIE